MTAPALVLVTTDLSDPRGCPDLGRSAAELGAELAAVQGEGPALTDVLTGLAGRRPHPSAVRLAVVPGPQPGTGASWVRRVAGHWLRGRGTTPFALELLPGVAAGPDPVAVRAHLRGTPTAVTGGEAALRSPAWEEVPEHAHHLLVCRGPRCTAQGAPDTAAALGAELRRRGWGDDVVLTTQTGCLFPCNQAPVVCRYPGGRWSGPVRPEDVPALLDDLVTDDEGGIPPSPRPSPSQDGPTQEAHP